MNHLRNFEVAYLINEIAYDVALVKPNLYVKTVVIDYVMAEVRYKYIKLYISSTDIK